MMLIVKSGMFLRVYDYFVGEIFMGVLLRIEYVSGRKGEGVSNVFIVLEGK